jgi:hypothetical protein
MLLVELKPAPNNMGIFNVECIQQCEIKFEMPNVKGILPNAQTAKDIGTQKITATSS